MCTLGMYCSTCNSKAIIKNNRWCAPGRLHNAFLIWYSITSSLVTVRKSPLNKEHVKMASIYFCLLVLGDCHCHPRFAKFSSTCPLHLQHDSTRWCQELLCSCNESEAFTCFVPQWEDASGLARRLFRNCFPKGLFPRFASKSRKRFVK